MSFWRSFGFHTVSAVENILERDSFTLEELMDEDELLQECKSQNQKLLDYLLQPDTLAKLLFYLTTDPEPEAESKTRQKYPFLACEILCLEVWEICEAIYDNTNLLDQLWAFLDQPPPLSSKTASHVCRVAGVLLQRKIAESFQYLKSKDNVAEKFLQHIGNASVNELLLKVVQCDETAEGSGIVKWLTEQNLVDHLIEKLHPDQSSTVHENAAQALVDMISSPSLASSALVAEVEREDTFQKLFNYVLSGKSISSLSNGLTVIIDVVKREVPPVAGQPQPVEVAPVNPPGYVKVCLNNVKQLVSILNSPGEKKVLTSFGEIFPIGTHRLKIVEFYSALLGKQFAGVETQLFDLGVFDVVLDLFFNYFWNNFLHAVVTDMVWVVLDNPQSPNVVRLLSEFKLLDRICDASDGNAADVNRQKGCTRGYMGFINRMSNRIVALQKTEPAVQQLCDAHDRWAEYVNVALKVQNDNDSMLLGGQKPVADESVQNSSGDEDGGMASMGNNELVNVFTQYLVKQGFTNDFPKDFLNDDDDEYDDEDEELEPGSRVLDKEFDEIQEPYTTEESDDEDEEDEVDGDEIISGADEDEDEGAGQGE